MSTSTVSLQLLAYATAAYESHHYEDAANYLMDIINVCPGNWQARLYLCSVYLESGLATKARHQSAFVAECAPDEHIREMARFKLKQAMRLAS